MQGGMKKSRFFTNISLDLGNDHATYTRLNHILWNANRKPYQSFRMVPFLMTLNDP